MFGRISLRRSTITVILKGNNRTAAIKTDNFQEALIHINQKMLEFSNLNF